MANVISSVTEQAVLVTDQPVTKPGQHITKLALFNADGTPFVGGAPRVAAFQANSTATDVATLVTNFNSLLAKLKAAGLMASA